MPQLNQLLNQLPQNSDIHMSTMGQVLWVAWHGSPPSAISQTLINYGGLLIGQSAEQSIWFFFSNDVFLALARLSIWGHFNNLPVAMELFPGRLQFTAKREASLGIEAMLSSQEMHPRESLDIFIHPSSKEGVSLIPGITFDRAAIRQGMAAAEWLTPTVDERLPYSSSQSWFMVVHPLGNPVDKEFQKGWGKMFQLLESLMQEMKVKSIIQDGFVLVAMENLSMLRTFLKKYLQVFDKEKQESGSYWPCVSVVADRKNLNFNSELPKRIGLKWDSLMPDFPYTSYRNAYLLGEGFVVRDLRFSGQTSMDSWCNVLLDENSISARSIPLVMSGHLASSQDAVECFYCGLPNHTACECPTRAHLPTRPETWQSIALMDLDEINAAFRKIEMALSSRGIHGFEVILEKGGSPAALLDAIFDLNGPSQLRNVPKNWLYKLREPDPDEEEPVKDESPAWDLLEKLTKTASDNLAALDKEITETIIRHPRDPRLRMVKAFVAIERNDAAQAMALFKEAGAITPSPALQAWNEYLQGRLLESQGQYSKASNIYTQVLRVMPQWREVTYRGIVCRVKMGFAEQVIDQIISIIKTEPEYFNRFLIDPALERGRLLILSALYDMWEEAKKNSASEISSVSAVAARLTAWFPDEHPVQARLGQKIHQLEAMGSVNNYMAFFHMVKFRPQLEKELNDSIQREVDELRNSYKSYLDVLEEIRDEASWFPFPSALREFSADFNESAGIINWAFGSNFCEPETFKRAQNSLPTLDKLLRNLKRRLHFLRTVRDATLFGLTMFKTFIWIEITGLLLCFLGVPAIVFFGDQIGLSWLKYLLGENQWSIQKVLVIIVTILALGIGALRTTLVFDKKKEKLLEAAREQREKYQATRVEAIKKKKMAEAKKLQKERAAANKKEMKRQLKARMQN